MGLDIFSLAQLLARSLNHGKSYRCETFVLGMFPHVPSRVRFVGRMPKPGLPRFGAVVEVRRQKPGMAQ